MNIVRLWLHTQYGTSRIKGRWYRFKKRADDRPSTPNTWGFLRNQKRDRKRLRRTLFDVIFTKPKS